MKRCQQGKGEKMNKIQGLGRRLKVVGAGNEMPSICDAATKY